MDVGSEDDTGGDVIFGRRGLVGRLDDAYGGDETVATAGEGFDEAGIFGGVAEGFADLVNGGAEGVVEIDDCVFSPETGLQFFAGDDLSGAFEEGGEDLEGLALKLDAEAGLPQFSTLQIDLVEAEAKSRVGNLARHGWRILRATTVSLL